jgi:hypothetical protein
MDDHSYLDDLTLAQSERYKSYNFYCRFILIQ